MESDRNDIKIMMQTGKSTEDLGGCITVKANMAFCALDSLNKVFGGLRKIHQKILAGVSPPPLPPSLLGNVRILRAFGTAIPP